MARAKPKWRRVLNARFLRWWLLGRLVRTLPALGRKLVFFPDHIDMIDGADKVLVNSRTGMPAANLQADMPFLRLCAPYDSRAPGVDLPNGLVTGQRTALVSRPWIDAATGSVLLPRQARTIVVRGELANWNATSAHLDRPRIEIEGRVFAPLITRNYFHMILENGVRLVNLLESGLVDDAKLTVIHHPGAGAVETAMYRGFALLYPSVRIRQVPRTALVVPDEAVLHFPSDNYWEWPPVSRVDAERLAAVFDTVHGNAAKISGQPVLYLSRAGTKLRNPLNSTALDRALYRRGISPFVANDANHAEQMARFRAAQVVVAVHGAGLTNLVFSAPGTRVVEIFPQNFVKSPYWRLANQLGLRYRPVICGPGDYDQRFTVDVAAVLAALDEI